MTSEKAPKKTPVQVICEEHKTVDCEICFGLGPFYAEDFELVERAKPN